MEAQRDFVGDLRSPGWVRQFLSQVLDGWGVEVGPSRDELLLLATELATNAVRHARDGFTVTVRVNENVTRVEVCDKDPTLPERRRPGTYAEGGWGLKLVERLATAWGAEPFPGGKVVWFEMALGSPRW